MNEKQILKNYLLELIISEEIPDILAKIQSHEEFSNLFDKSDLSYIHKNACVDIPDSLTKTELILDPNKKRKSTYLTILILLSFIEKFD